LISADSHAGADHDTYRSYLESKWHNEFDEWRSRFENPFSDLQREERTRNWDNDRRLRETHADGTVAEVLFPNTVPPFFPTLDLLASPPNTADYELRLAGIRAHNRWLKDFCDDAPGQRAGVGQIFINDIDDAIADVEWIRESRSRYGRRWAGRAHAFLDAGGTHRGRHARDPAQHHCGTHFEIAAELTRSFRCSRCKARSFSPITSSASSQVAGANSPSGSLCQRA
jgi:hypothetical protein